jgi:hypothetical protein
MQGLLRPFFQRLISDVTNTIILVCEDANLFCGFVIASLIEAAPV